MVRKASGAKARAISPAFPQPQPRPLIEENDLEMKSKKLMTSILTRVYGADLVIGSNLTGQ